MLWNDMRFVLGHVADVLLIALKPLEAEDFLILCSNPLDSCISSLPIATESLRFGSLSLSRMLIRLPCSVLVLRLPLLLLVDTFSSQMIS
jgi:hypothetical protein